MEVTKVHYNPADQITVKAKKKLSAGTFVVAHSEGMSGRTPVVDVAGADAYPLGVVAHDCEAGDHVTIYRAGHVVDVLATGSIAAGAKVSTAASGKVSTASNGPVVGIAVSAAASGKVTIALV
ncbi:hypothetical protein CMUST_01205 [Corynebacterium mustelae]|uniref:DUF2190 family protein n=1 Tax=Corynebacterium mustelae TaxID=571915 RepID=A0A0G3GVM5_9CORY|nr:DUF2190 family protein [Corynebacterium mustelae]AKK04590.1 hypothetical protein CMUST_01205 [Corynebacterium mustelae]